MIQYHQILIVYVHLQRRNIYAARNIYARAEIFRAEHTFTLADMFQGPRNVFAPKQIRYDTGPFTHLHTSKFH